MYSELIPVAYETLKGKAFAKNNDFAFAKHEAFCEIVYDEMGDTLAAFPIAMTYIEQKPKLIALFSVIPNQNCFVTPDGRWIGAYIPHTIKNYPFLIYPNPKSPTEQLLCIEKSSIVSDNDQKAQRLYTSEGEPNDFLKKFIHVQEEFHKKQILTDVAMKQLEQVNLFTEWELVVHIDNDQKQRVGGIYRINEERLRELPIEVVGELNRNGALGIAYAQLLSVNKIDLLKAVVKGHMEYIAEREKLSQKLDNEEGGTLDWGF